jgi:hypothetical protein
LEYKSGLAWDRVWVGAEFFGSWPLNTGPNAGETLLLGPSPAHATNQAMLATIDRLERRGYVRRLDDPDDRRGVIIELTDEGREVVDAAVAANTASDRQLLERLDPQEVEQLEGLLRKVLALLELPE